MFITTKSMICMIYMYASKSDSNVDYEYRDIQRDILNKYESASGWFWSFIKRYPFMFIFSVFMLLASAYFSTWTTSLIGTALDELLISGFSPEFNALIIQMLVLVAGSWVGTASGMFLWFIASFRVQRDMREEFYEVIQKHSMAFFDTHDSGNILSLGMNEINQMRMAINPSIRNLIRSAFSISITIIFLYNADPYIGLIILVTFLIYFIIAWRYAAKVGPIRQKLSSDLADLSSLSQEMFRGIDVVRSFDSHDKEITKFGHKSTEYAEDMKKEGYLSAFYWPSLLTVVMTALAFGIGLYNVAGGYRGYTIGVLITILALLIALNRQNFMIPSMLILMQAGLQNTKRLWNLMAFEDPLKEPEETKKSQWKEAISFNNVNFAYPGTDKLVLKDVSFTIPTGSRVALIGGPGSGKSTILKLLLRFYDIKDGTIKINDTNISDIHTSDIRKHATMVEQDIFLFGDTLKANIAFAKPDATDQEIKEAARKAQIAQFIESLPEKYETVIGERGVTLSGGQRQRVAIARALLSNPKLLLLDDSTSAVDIKTELRLRYAMEELMKNRTSIIVTQRLTTLVDADMIILMKRGQVVDIGTHNELISRCEEYQFMCKYLPMSDKMKDCGTSQLNGGGNNE